MIKRLLLPGLVSLLIFLQGCISAEPKDASQIKGFISSLAMPRDTLFICENGHVRRLNPSSRIIFNDSVPCEQFFQGSTGQILSVGRYHILVYDGIQWHEISILQAGPINQLSETTDGLIWISSSLLSSLDLQTGQTSIVVSPLLPPPATPAPVPGVWAVSLPSQGYLGPVFEASDGTLWYNQQFDGIVHWDRVTNQKKLWGPNDGFQGSVPLPTKYVQTRDGDIWVGTDTGIYRFHDLSWQTWVFPGEKSTKYRREEGDFSVIDMLEDRAGNVWVIFNRAGVAVWNGAEWRSVGNFEFPTRPQTILQDASGAIWIGSLQRGVAKYWQGDVKEYPEIQLTTFLETVDHRLWGGGEKGLFLYNQQTDQWESFSNK